MLMIKNNNKQASLVRITSIISFKIMIKTKNKVCCLKTPTTIMMKHKIIKIKIYR